MPFQLKSLLAAIEDSPQPETQQDYDLAVVKQHAEIQVTNA